MTSAQQTQYYSFLERQRKQAMYNTSLTYHHILNIRRFIALGGNPAEDPNLSAQYYLLIGEYGEGIFAFEDENGEYMHIQLENDTDIIN